MENTPTQEIVAKLITWIESTADFAKEQWPDYATQYMCAIAVKGWVNVIGCLVAIVILLIVGIYCIWFSWNWEGKSYEMPSIISLGSIMPFLIFIAPFGICIEETHRLITIYIAPKVYILNHLRGFIK